MLPRVLYGTTITKKPELGIEGYVSEEFFVYQFCWPE